MHASSKFFLLAVPLAALGMVALASDFFCNNYVAGAPAQHFQCVQTTIGPGAVSIILPDQAGSGSLTAASVSTGSGAFASVARVAEASPGQKLDSRLAQTLERVGDTKDAAQCKTEILGAKTLLADNVAFVKGEALIDHIDKNPFGVNAQVRKTITCSLTYMIKSIA